MKHKLHEEVISIIRNNLPAGENIVPFLSELLFLGKESIYRRIRGEIPFTLNEIVTISSRLGFSLNDLLGFRQSEHALFNVDISKSFTSKDNYTYRMQNMIQFFDELRKSNLSKSIHLLNHLPYSLSFYCLAITKFRYYKWLYQSQDNMPDFKMADVVVPDKILALRSAWVNSNRKMVHTTFIFDDNVFLEIVKDIDYFFGKGLISSDELEQLRDELIAMANEIEKIAEIGVGKRGASLFFYYSPLHSGACYSHFEFDNHMCCRVSTYDFNYFESYSERACKIQKDWINLFRKNSISLNGDNKAARAEYFNKQRMLIAGMGNNEIISLARIGTLSEEI